MNEVRRITAKKTIALVAHDNKKADLIDWAEFNKNALAKHDLIATGTTGKLLEAKLERPVKKIIKRPSRWRPANGRHDSRRKD